MVNMKWVVVWNIWTLPHFSEPFVAQHPPGNWHGRPWIEILDRFWFFLKIFQRKKFTPDNLWTDVRTSLRSGPRDFWILCCCLWWKCRRNYFLWEEGNFFHWYMMSGKMYFALLLSISCQELRRFCCIFEWWQWQFRGGIWLHSQLPIARVYGDY